MEYFYKASLGIALLVFGLCLLPVQGGQNIHAQTWLNMADAGKTGIYTAYQINEQGLVIQKKNYLGLGPSGKPISQTDFIYDAQRRLLTEKTTLTEAFGAQVHYQYQGSLRPTVILYQTPEGKEKFRDSLTYTAEGLLLQNRSYVDGKAILLQKFVYEAGKLAMDTALEMAGGIFIPCQGNKYAYDNSNRLVKEIHLQWVKGLAYITHSKLMEYNADGTLTNVREFAGSDETAMLLSSIDYRYNAQDLKQREEVSDEMGNLFSATEYFWTSGVSALAYGDKTEISKMAIRRIQGQYFTAPGHSTRLLNLQGRQLYSRQELMRGGSIRLSAPAILTTPKSSYHPQTSRSP